MNKIIIVNKHHKPSKDLPTFYCGRGSALGNPYSHLDSALAQFKVKDRNEACDKYQDYFHEQIQTNQEMRDQLEQIWTALQDSDVQLECFCAPHRCHTETIKQFIESQQTKSIKETEMKYEFTGMEWLAIDLANHRGEDKSCGFLGDKDTFENRIQWVKDHWNELEAHADKAEAPFLYRKAVMNIRRVAQGQKSGHMVALDATCSGIQVMSALTGCIKGATATGLIDPNVRADAYSTTQEVMNEILGFTGDDALSIARKEVKRAVMTSTYGSKKVPQEVFGEGEVLEGFYKATEKVAEGAFNLLDDLMETWKPFALAHEWTLPDGHYVNVKVMEKVEKRLEIDELNHYQMTAQFSVNQGKKRGVSNVANVVHSLDAYLLRCMVRRCNYNQDQVERVSNLITIELMQRNGGKEATTPFGVVAELYDLYLKTNMLDVVMINHIDEDTVQMLPSDYLRKLNQLLDRMQDHKPFQIESVHDAFMCHADNCNRLTYWYREIMAEFAESTILDFIFTTMMGKECHYPKYQDDLGDLIRKSRYAIC